VSLSAAAVVWLVFRSRHDLVAGAALLTATLLATPYAFVYDMPIISTAIIWVASERCRAGQALRAVDVAVMTAAMVAPVILVTPAPWGPAFTVVILAALLAVIVWRQFPAFRHAGLPPP
jgi:hypothetical protein